MYGAYCFSQQDVHLDIFYPRLLKLFVKQAVEKHHILFKTLRSASFVWTCSQKNPFLLSEWSSNISSVSSRFIGSLLLHRQDNWISVNEFGSGVASL